MQARTLPDDVRRRLSADFSDETYYEAVRQLEALALEPRALRAVVQLGARDLDALLRFARVAERDAEQVIFWAEHEEHDADAPRKVRSMDEPLPPREAGS